MPLNFPLQILYSPWFRYLIMNTLLVGTIIHYSAGSWPLMSAPILSPSPPFISHRSPTRNAKILTIYIYFVEQALLNSSSILNIYGLNTIVRYATRCIYDFPESMLPRRISLVKWVPLQCLVVMTVQFRVTSSF